MDDMKNSVSSEPGWNDPPLFAYDEHQAQLKQGKRANLNKRVAFPLTSAVTTSKSTDPTRPPETTSLLPPVTASHVESQQESALNKRSETCLDKAEALTTVRANFAHLLERYSQDDVSEIRRRLQVMEKMWTEDKLNANIYFKICELSKALKEGDSGLADQLQMGLMVDYAALCSPWISGVRHLIHNCRTSHDTIASS